MCNTSTSVNAMKWINAHSNELDSIRFQSASILVCSVREKLCNSVKRKVFREKLYIIFNVKCL